MKDKIHNANHCNHRSSSVFLRQSSVLFICFVLCSSPFIINNRYGNNGRDERKYWKFGDMKMVKVTNAFSTTPFITPMYSMRSNGRFSTSVASLQHRRKNIRSTILYESKSTTSDDLDLVKENALLKQELETLKIENKRLQKERNNLMKNENDFPQLTPSTRIIMENFEGSADTDSPRWFDDDITENSEGGNENYVFPTKSDSALPLGNNTSDISASVALSNNNNYDRNACPVEPDVSFRDAFRDRAYWLVGLLCFQSCSGFILSRNEELLQNHPVIIFFLTMLVGAGGNAGNQAAVRVIRGIALGRIGVSGNLNNSVQDSREEKRKRDAQNQFLIREFKMAFCLSSVLSVAGFLRAILFRTPLPETFAITLALYIIVFSSICLGALLPLMLKRIGVDPAHSSTTIQVIMDILGVVLTVYVSTAILDSTIGQQLLTTILGSSA